MISPDAAMEVHCVADNVLFGTSIIFKERSPRSHVLKMIYNSRDKLAPLIPNCDTTEFVCVMKLSTIKEINTIKKINVDTRI